MKVFPVLIRLQSLLDYASKETQPLDLPQKQNDQKPEQELPPLAAGSFESQPSFEE